MVVEITDWELRGVGANEGDVLVYTPTGQAYRWSDVFSEWVRAVVLTGTPVLDGVIVGDDAAPPGWTVTGSISTDGTKITINASPGSVNNLKLDHGRSGVQTGWFAGWFQATGTKVSGTNYGAPGVDFSNGTDALAVVLQEDIANTDVKLINGAGLSTQGVYPIDGHPDRINECTTAERWIEGIFEVFDGTIWRSTFWLEHQIEPALYRGNVLAPSALTQWNIGDNSTPEDCDMTMREFKCGVY